MRICGQKPWCPQGGNAFISIVHQFVSQSVSLTCQENAQVKCFILVFFKKAVYFKINK